MINGTWIEEPTPIKEAIFDFFRKHYKESDMNRPTFTNQRFNKLNDEESKALEATFRDEEIKNAVWLCGGSKAPEADCFNFSFIKANWEIMKVDVCKAILKFEASGKIGKGCHSSFIALILKVKDSLLIPDFRLISLIDCFYKIIAKLLSEIIKGYMNKLVSEMQTTFV